LPALGYNTWLDFLKDIMQTKSQKQIERDEQIYELTTLVAGEFSLQEVLDRLAEAAVKITNYIDPDGKMKRQTYRVNTAPLRTANAERQGRREATYPERSCSQED